MSDLMETVLGRMSVGQDVTDFDIFPIREEYMSGDEYTFIAGEDESDEDDVPDPFSEPKQEHFPRFKAAVQKFKRMKQKPRVARIDTENTYGEFVCDAAVKEIGRKLDELRLALDEHASDPLAHPHEHVDHRMVAAKSDILGAAEAVARLASAPSAKEAAKAMPKVPLDVPPFAQGKIDCWKDGDSVVCSIKFLTIKGKPRIATMAAKPVVDEQDVIRGAIHRGLDPVTVLGAAHDAAEVACGKKLLKDVAGAALSACRRDDVCGMDELDEDGDVEEEAILLARGDDEELDVPLAAMMELEQAAQAGDQQAKTEKAKIAAMTRTPVGRRVLGPVVEKSKAKLALGRAKKSALSLPPSPRSFAQHYDEMFGYLIG